MSEVKDGGPAFPQFDVVAGDRDGHGDAIEAYTVSTGGMALRDYFAARAMSALIPMAGVPNVAEKNKLTAPDLISRSSYEMADAMLAARGTS